MEQVPYVYASQRPAVWLEQWWVGLRKEGWSINLALNYGLNHSFYLYTINFVEDKETNTKTIVAGSILSLWVSQGFGEQRNIIRNKTLQIRGRKHGGQIY